jgi:cathepsin L
MLSHRRHAARLRMLQGFATPPSFDSRTLGIIGPIKDQGQCGSCWDFSGTCVVEVAYNKAGIGGGADKMILSEEYTLSCTKNGGCNGDDNVTVLDWAKSTGLPLTADYGAYKAAPGKCAFTPNMTLYKIDDWGFADSNGGNGITPVQDIKNAIVAYGCVGCAVAAGSSWDTWSSDPNYVHTGTSTSIDHDVDLVAWDDAKGRKGAWLMRNHWGTSWANGGYGWIEYGADSIGTEAVFAVIHGAAPVSVPIVWDL